MNRFQVYRGEDESLRWRLVGGNHRVVALSPFPFTSAAKGWEHVLLVRRLVEGGALTVDTDRAEHGWTWRLDDTVDPAAVGHTSFARRADARSAALRFLDCAGAAQLAPGVIVRPVGTHPLSLCGVTGRAGGRAWQGDGRGALRR